MLSDFSADSVCSIRIFGRQSWGEMRTVPARQLMMMMLGGMAGLLVTQPPAAALPLVPTGRTGGGTPT